MGTRAWLWHESPELLPGDTGTYKVMFTHCLTTVPLAPHEEGMLSFPHP